MKFERGKTIEELHVVGDCDADKHGTEEQIYPDTPCGQEQEKLANAQNQRHTEA